MKTFSYKVTDPQGKEYITNNLTNFCRNHHLEYGSMNSLFQRGSVGKRGSTAGWKCCKVAKQIDKVQTQGKGTKDFIDNYQDFDKVWWYNAEDVLLTLGYVPNRAGKLPLAKTSLLVMQEPRKEEDGKIWWNDVTLAKLKHHYKVSKLPVHKKALAKFDDMRRVLEKSKSANVLAPDTKPEDTEYQSDKKSSLPEGYVTPEIATKAIHDVSTTLVNRDHEHTFNPLGTHSQTGYSAPVEAQEADTQVVDTVAPVADETPVETAQVATDTVEEVPPSVEEAAPVSEPVAVSLTELYAIKAVKQTPVKIRGVKVATNTDFSQRTTLDPIKEIMDLTESGFMISSLKKLAD